MLLNDYTDYFPFMVYRTDPLVEPDVLADGRPSADVSGLFPVPLDVDLLSDVTISRELSGETAVLVSTPSEHGLSVSAAKLFLSYDGEAVLLFTAESGELWLTTYDVNSGETRRERLMDAGEAAALGANLSLSGMRGIVEQEGYETFRDAEGAIFSRRAAALRTLTELNFN